MRAVLEALLEAGILSLARREGNRRWFDLTERLYPAELLARRIDPLEQRRHKLLSRYRAHGLLGEGGESALWYGIGPARRSPSDPRGTVTRGELRAELEDAGAILAVSVDGLRGTRFVLREELDLLESAQADVDAGRPLERASVVLLAPLDSLAWDRDLLGRLFGFEYRWEVYVPRPKRRWGYYVLPLLWGDRFVGRIEPRIDRAAAAVRVLGLQWEADFRPRRSEGFVDAMRDALAAYARFAGARTIDWGSDTAARRLFGVRPRAA